MPRLPEHPDPGWDDEMTARYWDEVDSAIDLERERDYEREHLAHADEKES